ncbi:hypothetical protein TVAG_382270 [Trichomonas vaginalis G3]|uniref:Leucine Rich Repeat family protein n=1 Tax=Trichomonas vaginalis (strain ATCC PRA-98 / G3) TaxID=412133 RepID=A2FNE6_TRIV3|nr:L domain-like family [Trichomonas vaginalis G3]EAX93582.1 hypothetical protein TVAG_382270 [Trichomonas vaginalis G3]KAI5540348.1 L domain-like family [Trichomonas vaginalis G3]|eukprot:XP_001306512.1 hypothetical protein [Trichomonas vaginalis G3]
MEFRIFPSNLEDMSYTIDENELNFLPQFINLQKINFTTEQVTKIAIKYLNLTGSKVNEIILPGNTIVNISDGALQSYSLQKINIHGNYQVNLKNLFENCPNLLRIDFIDFNDAPNISELQGSNLKEIHLTNSFLEFKKQLSFYTNLQTIIINDQYTVNCTELKQNVPKLSSFSINQNYKGYFKGNIQYSSNSLVGGISDVRDTVPFYFVNSSIDSNSIDIETNREKQYIAYIYQLSVEKIISFTSSLRFKELHIKTKNLEFQRNNNNSPFDITNLFFEDYEILTINENSFKQDDSIQGFHFKGGQIIIRENAFKDQTINLLDLQYNSESNVNDRSFVHCNIQNFLLEITQKSISETSSITILTLTSLDGTMDILYIMEVLLRARKLLLLKREWN